MLALYGGDIDQIDDLADAFDGRPGGDHLLVLTEFDGWAALHLWVHQPVQVELPIPGGFSTGVHAYRIHQ